MRKSKKQDFYDAGVLASIFHAKYEEFAPKFGYSTRKQTAVPWEDVPPNNKALMTEVCQHIIDLFKAEDLAVPEISRDKTSRDITLPKKPISKYPFTDLEVGDSFLVEAGPDEHILIVQQRMNSSMYSYCKRFPDVKLTSRRDVPANGVRCWRIK